MTTSTVLVLDLAPERFTFLGWFLQLAGITTCQASTVAESLEVFASQPTDAVVINSDAPEAELTGAVQSLHELVPRPLVATYRSPTGPVSGSDLSISHPYDVDDVITPLVSLLSQRPEQPLEQQPSASAPPASA